MLCLCISACVCVCVDWTKRGVQIPLADGMDFVGEVVEYHNVSTILYIQHILYIISLILQYYCVYIITNATLYIITLNIIYTNYILLTS